MPRVPFSFTLTGGADIYGDLFANADDVIDAAAQGNDVLVSLLAITVSPALYGITLPPTATAYKITKVYTSFEDVDDDLQVGIFDGTNLVVPFATIINGDGEHDFGESGLIVPAGYKPFIKSLASGTASRVAGWVDWEKVTL